MDYCKESISQHIEYFMDENDLNKSSLPNSMPHS